MYDCVLLWYFKKFERNCLMCKSSHIQSSETFTRHNLSDNSIFLRKFKHPQYTRKYCCCRHINIVTVIALCQYQQLLCRQQLCFCPHNHCLQYESVNLVVSCNALIKSVKMMKWWNCSTSEFTFNKKCK